MPTAELEVRRGVELATRGGSARATADYYLLPRSETEAALALAEARRRVPAGATAALTFAGAERSFEAHFLPRAVSPRVIVSSRRLRGDVQVLGTTTTTRGEPAVAVRALAGTSFGELLSAVKRAGFETMPFSCPTADAISLGGALAVNTHSRTSATYGGLFAEHVRRFTLLGADGLRYDCHAEATSALERRLFRYVPGALGALGLVTELELELTPMAADARVVTEVLDRRENDPAGSVAAFLERLAADERARDFSEGFSLVFFGPPGRGTGVVVGRRRGAAHEPRRATLPLFRENADLNLLVQLFAHRFPGVSRRLAARLLAPGRSFSAPYYRWAFFQSSFDDGAQRLARRSSEAPPALTQELGLVHQGWVLTSAALGPFVALASELFADPDFRPIADALEFFDVLPLPAPVAPLDPSRSLATESASTGAGATRTHVLTLSIAVREARTRELAKSFCRTLTERAASQGLGVVVQLNKQHHASPTLLRAMHRTALSELASLKAEVDQSGLIGSRTLERLGL
ncbi:MAG TPA: hypothetical protein VGQ57_03170 [Polyangiaceae bacterium]|jgi:FAD/FMN-containing dehydrogenase|nr:hypothetical protein [Polyangiaceae bacterium]